MTPGVTPGEGGDTPGGLPGIEVMEAGEVARLLSYVAILAGSAYLFFDARALPTSRGDVLGAGAFPQLVFATLALLAAAALAASLRKVSRQALRGFGAATVQWLRHRYLVVCVLGLFGLYLAVLPILGFSLATFGFLLVTQLLLLPRSAKAIAAAVVIALLFSFGLNALFDTVFNVFLPRGGI
ncbi:MAG: tripartite tricarboxylate transporter TctB family protein [Kiloniellaceae bacterium]